jgi:hypothetical protein
MSTTDFDDLAPDRDWQFVSLGSMCGLLQCLPAQLKVLMEATDVRFALVLDGVGYLRVADAETVAAKCRDCWKELADVSSSHHRN